MCKHAHTHTHTASGFVRQNQENNRFGHEGKMIRRKKESLETDSSQVYRKLWNKEYRHPDGKWVIGLHGEESGKVSGLEADLFPICISLNTQKVRRSREGAWPCLAKPWFPPRPLIS